jgi:hypothetical protein
MLSPFSGFERVRLFLKISQLAQTILHTTLLDIEPSSHIEQVNRLLLVTTLSLTYCHLH